MIRAALVVSEGRHDHRNDEGQKRPEGGEDLADVVAAAAEDGEDGIADGALQGAAREAAVGLHMADLGFDGRTTPELAQQVGRKAVSCAAYHRRSRAETKMNCVKLLDQRLTARDFDHQVAEFQVRVAILNGFSALGTPVTEVAG